MSCPSFRRVNKKVFLQELVVSGGDKIEKKKCRKLHSPICKKTPSSVSSGHPETAAKDTAMKLELRLFL